MDQNPTNTIGSELQVATGVPSETVGISSYTSPTFTDKTLPDQSGRVFVVTGSASGVSELLANILYSKNGKVYTAARSARKAESTSMDINRQHPNSMGELIYLPLNLDDLTTVKASAEHFLQAETRLDVLFNDAGVMAPLAKSKWKQGHSCS